MLHFNSEGKIDLVYDPIKKCLVKSDVISDILAIVGTTVDNPFWYSTKEINMKNWSGNFNANVDMGSQLTDFINLGIFNNNIINETVMSINNALQSLIRLGRIKSVQIEPKVNFKGINKLTLVITVGLNDGQEKPIYFKLKR